MFSFLELPRTFDATRKAFTDLSHQVIDKLEAKSEETLVRSDEKLDELVRQKRGIYWVTEGSLLVTYHEKRILAFEAGECFALDGLVGEGPFSLVNELAVRIGFVSLRDLSEMFVEDNELAVSCLSLQSTYSQVLAELLSTSPLLESPFDPTLLNVDAGDVVITQGDEGTEIFTLVKGELEVEVKGVKVGTIQEGEIFGVIAAFTGGARTATVSAKSESLIMQLPKSEFDALVKQRPSLITSLVESLSRTIVELDERVLEQQQKS